MIIDVIFYLSLEYALFLCYNDYKISKSKAEKNHV